MPRARTWTVVVYLGLVAACGPRSNPYDEMTPVELQARARLQGVARDAATSQTLTGAQIAVAGAMVPDSSPATTAADGAFAFGDLIAGRYQLTASHASHLPQTLELELAPGEARTLELLLAPLGQDGAQAHLTGVAHKSGELALPPAQQDHAGILVEVEGTGLRTVTNSVGAFDLFLLPGTYSVVFSATGYVSTRRDDVVVVAGDAPTTVPDSPVVLAGNPGVVSGRVQVERPEIDPPADDAGITISLQGSAQTTSAADGTYRLTGVAPGTYTLTASRTRWEDAVRTNVVVRPGQETVVEDLLLPASRNAVRGSVDLADSDDDSGVALHLTGTTFAAVSSPSGLFQISGVPVGSFELTTSRQGYVREVRSVLVERTAPAEVGTITLIPRQGDFDIDDGAAYTNDPGRVVTLNLNNDSAAHYRASEDGVLVDADWQVYEATPSFVLSEPDGQKSVHVWYRDATDTVSRRFSSSILLDRQPPVVQTFGINGGAGYTNTTSGIVTLGIAVTDDSGSGVQQMQVATAPDFTSVPLEPYNTTMTFTLSQPGSDGLKQVWAQFWDRAGNVTASPSVAHIVLDTLAPTLAAVDGFVINDGASYATSHLVELGVRSDDATRLAVSNQAGLPVAIFQPCSAPVTHVSWYLSPGEGLRTVYLLLQDEAGNVSNTAFEASISVDRTPPTSPSILLDDGAAYSRAPAPHTVQVTLAAQGASAYQLSLSGAFSPVAWQAMTTSPLTTSLDLDGSQGLRTVYALFRDDAGNTTQTVTDSIELDAQAPVPGTTPLRIQSGASMASQRSVTLSLDATGASEMRIVADETDDTEPWTAFADTASALLLDADCGAGQLDCREVCAWFRDAAHNSIGPFCDRITLDRVAPTVPIFVTPPRVVDAASVAVDIASAVSESFFSAYEILVAPADNAFHVVSTTQATTRFTASLSQGNAGVGGSQANTIRLRAVDQAGNVSAESVVVITEDSVAPAAPLLRTPAHTMLNADTAVAYLDLGAPGAQAFDDPNFAYYELRGGGFGSSWVATPLRDGFLFELVQGDGSHCGDLLNPANPNQLQVRGVDLALHAGPVAILALCEDSVAPTPPELTPRLATVNADTIRLKLLTQSQDINFGAARYQVQGGTILAFTDTPELDFFEYGLLPDRSNELCLRGVDQAGNEGATDCVTLVEQSTFDLRPDLAPIHSADLAGDFVVFVDGSALLLHDLVDGTTTTVRTMSGLANPDIGLAVDRTLGSGATASAVPDQLRVVWNENGGHQLWTYTRQLHDRSQTSGPTQLYVDATIRFRPKTDGMSIVYANNVVAGATVTLYTSIRTGVSPTFTYAMREQTVTGSQTCAGPASHDLAWDGRNTVIAWCDQRADTGGDVYRVTQRWRSAAATAEAVASGTADQVFPAVDGKGLSWVQDGSVFAMDVGGAAGTGVDQRFAASRLLGGYAWLGSPVERNWLLYVRDNGATGVWLTREAGGLTEVELSRGDSQDVASGPAGTRWASRVAWSQGGVIHLTDLGETKFVIADPSSQTGPVVSGDLVGWIDGSDAVTLNAQFLDVATGDLYQIDDVQQILSYGGVYAAVVGMDDVSRIVNVTTGAAVIPLAGATAEIRINDAGTYAVWFEPVNVNDVPIFGSALPAPGAPLVLNRTAVTTTVNSRAALDVAGDVVVWQQSRFSPQVYCLDLSVGSELLVASTPVNTLRPRVAIDPTNAARVDVVFDDNLLPSRTLYFCNITCSGAAPLCATPRPASPLSRLDEQAEIADGLVVWRRRVDGASPGTIVMHDPRTGLLRNLTFDKLASVDASSPSVSGNRVVWQDHRLGNADILMHVLER